MADDYTVKVIVDGLDPGRTYNYRFFAAREASPWAGPAPFRAWASITCALPTPPVPTGSSATSTPTVLWRGATTSTLCSILATTSMSMATANMATGPTLGGATRQIGRSLPLPIIENAMLSIEQMQICKNCTDSILVVIWDDHESATNSWRMARRIITRGKGLGRAETGSGESVARVAAHSGSAKPGTPEFGAASASVNCSISPCWIPVSMAGIEAANPKDHAVIQNPKRSLLGPTQEAWLYDQLHGPRATACWRILGQQVMLGQLGGYGETPILNTDQWDGYPHARTRLLNVLEEGRIDNVAVLTGDIHSSWALDVARDPRRGPHSASTGKGSLAVESVTPSVTPPLPHGQESRGTPGSSGPRDPPPHEIYRPLFSQGLRAD